MTTKIKNKIESKSNVDLSIVDTLEIETSEHFSIDPTPPVRLPLAQIELSRSNYRRYFCEKKLKDLADNISLLGMISPVTVRLIDFNRYELIVGERRIRAARIIHMLHVPAVIIVCTDAQANEIRLSENLQREDPHPLEDAQAIGMMQEQGKTIEEIAARLGKSKSFVYGRIQLLKLIPEFQEIFISEKINMLIAFELSNLPEISQNEIYQQYCTNWKDEDFALPNIKNLISRYKYDLNSAPFDTKDNNLIPEVGACSNCPFNSATMVSLFPEMAEEALCSNKECFQGKCIAQTTLRINQTLIDYHPDAIITSYIKLAEEEETVLNSLEQTAGLPRYRDFDVTILSAPELPDRQDYCYEEDNDESFDESGYQQAMEEYQDELSAYEEKISGEGIMKGLYFYQQEILQALFVPEKETFKVTPKKVTAKEVQTAIKSGDYTAELLQGEITRLESREKRNCELDKEKVQQNIYSGWCAKLHADSITSVCTEDDNIALRLLVYQSMDYHFRKHVDEALFSTLRHNHQVEPQQFLNALADLSEPQFCYLIRMAVISTADCKLPNNIRGIAMYNMAASAGHDVKAIEKKQNNIAKKRNKKLKPRIKALNVRLTELSTKVVQDQQE